MPFHTMFLVDLNRKTFEPRNLLPCMMNSMTPENYRYSAEDIDFSEMKYPMN